MYTSSSDTRGYCCASERIDRELWCRNIKKVKENTDETFIVIDPVAGEVSNKAQFSVQLQLQLLLSLLL